MRQPLLLRRLRQHLALNVEVRVGNIQAREDGDLLLKLLFRLRYPKSRSAAVVAVVVQTAKVVTGRALLFQGGWQFLGRRLVVENDSDVVDARLLEAEVDDARSYALLIIITCAAVVFLELFNNTYGAVGSEFELGAAVLLSLLGEVLFGVAGADGVAEVWRCGAGALDRNLQLR